MWPAGLALENPDAFFLSQSGECFHNVTVTGGKQRSEGPLSMKRELRDVLRQLEELERALREEEMRVLTLGRAIKEFTSLMERLEGRKARSRASVDDFSPHAAAARFGDESHHSSRIEYLAGRIAAPCRGARRTGIALCTGRQADIAAVEEKRAQIERQVATATGIARSAPAAARRGHTKQRRSAWPESLL